MARSIPSLVAASLQFVALACALVAAPERAPHHAMPPLDLRAFAGEAAATLSPGASAPNFRLTDHRGVTRELYYESTAKAIVLVFTAPGSPRALQTAASLRALRARFPASDVVLWQIDSNLGATSPALIAEQALYNNPLPVLLDEAQLVASEFGATRELETFVLDPRSFYSVAYRGPFDNADPFSSSAATEHYAGEAVAALLAGRTVAPAQRELAATARRLDLPAAPAMNYASDVAPIVMRRCLSCHSPGNIAPHTYSKYEDLSSRATSIRASMLLKRMAPWHADPQYGAFTNTPAITAAESATLHAWAKAGAPRGTGADPLVTAPQPPSGDWPLGQPDLIVTIPRQELPARGTIEYKYLTVAVPVTAERWLRAAVVKPGNRRVVHHALVFEGTILDVLSAGGGLGGFFAGYVPGLEQLPFPSGTGKRLKPNSSVTFQMHYTASGQVESDETQLGFYFASSTPERELLTRAAATVDLTIAPGARDYERTASLTPSTTRDVMLYEFSPHMHYRGKRFRYEAVYPGGATEVLLNVPNYNFDWQSLYRLAQPKRLPAGTVIRVVGAFDNSAQNPYNPNPAATVRFGEQTDDEMFIGYLNYAELPSRAPAPAPAFAGNTSARARVGQAFQLALRASNSPTAWRAEGLPAGLRIDATNGTISGTAATAGRHAILVTAENASGAASMIVDLSIAAPSAPIFTTQPLSVRTRIGGTATFTAAVDAGPGTIYTWFFRGGEFCNTDAPVLELKDVTAGYVGDYYCVASNASGATRSASATLSLDAASLVNLSARANVGTGASVVIPGITMRGTQPKSLLIRAAGPALTGFGVAGALANPLLSVFNVAGEKVLENDNWSDAPNLSALRTAAATLGAFALPEGSRDAAMLVTLPPGSYTVQVAGVGTGTAAQGVAIVEIYEADQATSTLVNLSCRARVGTGADILIAGFVIGGAEPRRMLIRGIGPTLGTLGVTGALADPKLDILRQDASAVASNDNWDGALTATFSAVGAFPLNAGSRDAALVVTLQPGTYTAQLSGVGGTSGLGLIEVYELP